MYKKIPQTTFFGYLQKPHFFFSQGVCYNNFSIVQDAYWCNLKSQEINPYFCKNKSYSEKTDGGVTLTLSLTWNRVKVSLDLLHSHTDVQEPVLWTSVVTSG